MISPSSTPVPTARTGRRGRSGWRLAVAVVPALALGVAVLPAAPAAAKKKDAEVRQIVTGWLPYWTTSASIATLQANKDLLQEVSPFWYTLNWSGGSSVIGTQVTTANKVAVKAAAAQAGIELWPSFTDSMPARRLAAVMGKKATRQALVDRMVTLAVQEGYAGLDLDFEKFAFGDGQSTWATTSVAWAKFVKRLGNKLHKKGKKLAATTPSLCTMAGACSARSGYWVYNWAGIAPYIDRLRIMAYDYSVSAPGPIGPYPWTEAITRYAASVVAPGKVQIGVPTYGRDWVQRNPNGSLRITGTCPKNGSLPSSYKDRITFDSRLVTSSFLSSRGLKAADLQWDDTRKETFFRYTRTYSGPKNSCTVYREGWYGDSRAVVARAGLVTKYGIAGIAAWTIGGEDPKQWDALRSLARGIAPTSTAVTARVPATVRYGTSVTVSATVRSQGVAVQDASVVLQWRGARASAWTQVATGTTNAAGVVSWSRAVVASGTYRTVVAKTFERAGASATASVRVRPVLTPKDRAVTATAAGRAVLRAVLAPKAGQQVVVQKRVNGKWVKYADARFGGNGNPKRAVHLSGSKDAFRFKAKASTVSAKAVSAAIRVTR